MPVGFDKFIKKNCENARVAVVVVPRDARRGQQAVNDGAAGIQVKKNRDTDKDFQRKKG